MDEEIKAETRRSPSYSVTELGWERWDRNVPDILTEGRVSSASDRCSCCVIRGNYCERAGHTRSEVGTQRGRRPYTFVELEATFRFMLCLGMLRYLLPTQKSVHMKETRIV